MKFRKLCAVALVAVIGMQGASVASASTNIDSPEGLSNGSVTIGDGTVDPGDENVPDPEDPTIPGIKPTDPVNPVNPGTDITKGLQATTDLKFGTIGVGTNRVYAAANEVTLVTAVDDLTGVETTEQGTRGHLISFLDLSSTPTGYYVSAELTQQFTRKADTGAGVTEAVLSDASLYYNYGILGGANTTNPASLLKTSFELSLGASQDIVQADAGKGAGKWTLEFGQSENSAVGTPDTVAEGVQLRIPAATADAMTAGTYEAVVTWTMGTAPTETP